MSISRLDVVLQIACNMLVSLAETMLGSVPCGRLVGQTGM